MGVVLAVVSLIPAAEEGPGKNVHVGSRHRVGASDLSFLEFAFLLMVKREIGGGQRHSGFVARVLAELPGRAGVGEDHLVSPREILTWFLCIRQDLYAEHVASIEKAQALPSTVGCCKA